MACGTVVGEEARIVLQQICTVGSSDATLSSANSCAVSRPDDWPSVCWANAQRAWEAGSVLEVRAERTALDWPEAIWARYIKVWAAGRLSAERVLMSYDMTEG